MAHVIVRSATKADIEAFSGMADKPTLKAMVGEIDGRIIGIGGVALAKGRWFGFVDLTEEARPYKMHIMRAAKRVLAEAKREGIRFIYAEASPHEPGAIRWLTSLGFKIDPRSQLFYRWSANDDA